MTLEVDSSKQRCMNCGEVVEGKKFCKKCGTKVIKKNVSPNLQEKPEISKTAVTKIAELGISEDKQEIVFYARDTELFRCRYQEFATATVEPQTRINRFLGIKTLIIRQQSNGIPITRTVDIPDKYYLLAKTKIESTGLSLQPSASIDQQEESALSLELRSRPQRVDNELLTYDPKDENGPRFKSVPVNERTGHTFNLYVPETLATLLNNAPFFTLKDVSHLLKNEENTNIFGHTIHKSQLLQSLSGIGVIYPFRRKLSDQRLNGGDVQSHEIYLPVYDTQGKAVIISMDQTNFTKLFEGYSNVMDQPLERMLIQQNSLQLLPYNLYKNKETVKATVAQGVLRTPIVESGVNREASISVQAGTTRGERSVNQDTLIAQQVTMADNTIVTLLEVYDGMGGHGSGEKASKEAAKNEITFLTTLTFQQISELKYRAQTNNRSYEIELADAMLQYVADQTPQKIPDDAGTTKTGSIILNGKCVVTSKGDSRTYVFRGGQPVLRTQDHSLVARLVAAGQITPQEATTHPQKNLIYKDAFNNKGANTVATHPLQSGPYEIAEIVLQDGDVILSMCDGVIGGLESQGRNPEAELSALSQSTSGHEAIQALDQFANGGGDNDTFLFARYKKH